MRVDLEKHFEVLLQDVFTKAGAHVVRLPDDLKVALAQGSSSAKGKRKPYDFGACFAGHYYAVECKLVKGIFFSSLLVADHQWQGLKEAQLAGATPLLAIYFKHKVVKKLRGERTETFTEKWVLVDLSCEDIDKLRKECFSWRVDWIEEHFGKFYCRVEDQLLPSHKCLGEWLP